MSLHQPNHAPEIPQAVLDTFRSSLSMFHLPVQTPDTLDLHSAHHTFHLGLDPIKAGVGAAAAKQAGWRLFVGTDNKVRGDVRTSPSGWKLAAVFHKDSTHVDMVQHQVRACDCLDRLQEVQNYTYSLRLLKIPGLNLEAFWLVAQDAQQEDLLVPFREPKGKEPYPTLIGKLDRPTPFTMTDFLKVIRPLAEKRLQYPRPYGS
jgi:hypothetical protein